METVKDIKEMFKGEYDHIEVYRNIFYDDSPSFHTDNVKELEEFSDDDLVRNYELMDEEDYNRTILANTGTRFEDIFDKNDKILVILLKV